MIDFPTNPTIGQIYPPGSVPEGNKQWKWNGQGWELMMYSSAQVVEMARLASNASASAQQAVDNATLSDQYRTDAQQAAATAGSIAGGMENAIAFANTFTAVPATNQGPMIVVTQPHMRFMVWNGAKYVRAPWHQPGTLRHVYRNLRPGELEVRADVTLQSADFPDLAEYLGVTGSTFVLDEARGEFVRNADSGRGKDAGRVVGSHQGDAGRNLTGAAWGYAQGTASGNLTTSGAFGSTSAAAGVVNAGSNPDTAGNKILNIDASRQWPTANEFRATNLAYRLAVTY